MSIYLDEFEILYGISDNIEKLRSKILELAFRGELTKEINTHEFNAEKKLQDLLKKRKTMIKNKEIRKPRKPRGKDFEKPPFPIPKQWLWVKLIDSIGTMTGPKKLKKKDIYDNGEIPVVSQSQELIVGYTDDKDAKLNIKNPLIIFGDHTTNIKFIDFDFAVGSDGVKILKPIIMTEKLFYYYLKFININQEGYKRHFSKLKTKLVPLIPIEEQKRIVNKIEKLMKEVDKLEKKLKEKEDISQNLSESVVEAIKSGQDTEKLKGILNFIIDNFDVVFKTSESMDEMRNIILQLAIEGKLVQQDENDEPASELIDRLKIKSKELIKEGKLKNSNIKEINENEIPFKIPYNWEWVRANQITEINPRSSIDDEKKVSFVPMSLIEKGYGSGFNFEIKKWKEIKEGYTHFAENDIGVAKITPCFQNRKSLIFKDLKSGFGAGTTELHIIRVFLNDINRKYLLYFFKTDWFIKEGIFNFSGTAGQQRINTTFMKNTLIPLPPIEEQRRIVKKVDSIMKIIDKLEEKMEKKENLVKKLGTI